ncbi:peptidoglycan/xylan/chitin deacetylase (PgdA/CDA1 family) [Ureibacillus xyleni]|uniref:Peptidoglycan/xylan/chitin deacetylase (PgdA/CDA1 family) n=1 Tax=Ureibacillus xyleni TaxID=614648 RepID=A0A285SWR7_9BACL|nr:polysaccharide deacetylase family protein [Ureibacillus xyleni]SOC10997.1 peptidoglycan/xylan/chitin deacetylase (PgdA/CDA1 family) [Ureibacillus xyleni]
MNNDRQEKRRSWVDYVLVSSIFTLTVLIGIFIFTNGDSKFQSTISAKTKGEIVNDTQKLLSETKSEYNDIQIVTETSEDPTMPYSLYYPKTKFEHVNKEISQYITKSKENYFNAVRLYKNAHPDSDAAGKYQLFLDINEHNKNYYSVVLKNKLTVDQANYDITYQTYLFNKHTGELVTAYQLFDQKTENLEVFAKYVKNQLTKNLNKSTYTEKLNKSTDPYWKNYKRLAIINDRLVVYFNSGEIADPLAGAPTVIVPLSYLNPILEDSFKTVTLSKETIIPVKPSGTGKRVALTFDDGPHEKITRQILNTLKKYDAKATFFMVGRRVPNNTKLVKDIYNSGHEIGNHTWNHPKLTSLTSKQVESQITSTDNSIYKAIGQYPTVFRPPYGAKNKRVTDVIDVPVVMWTIDTLDWKQRNANKLLPMVKKNLHNNAIILMHDIHQSTADGLDSVLAYLQKEGYECVTVSEILASQK